VYGGLRDRQSPIVTQRVFVIPGVSQAFVAMHGVFDRTREAHPSEGLQSRRFGTHGVRFDAQDGGFPVVMSNAIVGFNGVPYLASRRLSKPDERATGGELVYAMATTSIRTQPYYPDPAANAYVIGVRVAGTGIYLEGGPCVISAYGSGYRYPDARPLVLTIQRVSKPRRRAAELTLDEVLSWPKKDSNGRLPSLPNGATRLPGAVEALLSLAPGEDFEVDVWCVPESGDLAKRFAVIESVGALAIARARKDTAQSPPTRQQVCVALAQMLPKIACVEADKCLPDPGNDADPLRDWEEGCGGPGGLPAPGPETLGAIARALHVALLGRPLDELTAVRTLRATHATDRPSLAPELVLQTSDEPLPTLTRVADMPNERNAYVANGHIAFHLPTTGCIELSAEMASPSSDTFDDVRRGRSLLDKRFGTWPREEGVPVPVKRIFGFDISATGEVTLPKTKHVALYRLDDIPLPIPPQESAEGDPPAQPAQDGELHTIPLEAVLKLRGRDPTLGSGKSTFQFSDGLARLLCLKVTAYARHGDQMRTASAPAKNGEWLRDGAALSSEQAAAYSGYVSAWLLANVRPAEPSTRTPVPAFVWITEPTDKKPGVTTWEVRRRSIIRIPLLRPWFSSGEDERLGIVVWPPNLFTHHEGQLADDEVNNGRVMTLTDFQDEDLGPGGKFITRWGGDPIRTPAPRISQRRTFIPAKAFVDQSQDIGTGFKAELVSNVKMPIRITEDGAPDAKAPTTVPPTLEVSLLTYQPKFDVEEELWYVDVTLEHEIEAEPFVRLGLVRFQPHAPPHLQVSYPVTQWTQLLPRRCAKITKSTSAVTVHVEGLASAPGPTDLGPEDTNDERRSVPRLTARIVRECDPDKGIPTRSVIEEAHLEPIIKNLPTAEKYHAVWEKEMPFAAQKPDDARERSKYFVVLEEKELRLPATYLNEPVSREMALGRTCENGEAEDVMVESGTRFFVRIELDA
jgi:hypothetical protein